MSRDELELIKKAAKDFARRCNTPEKARQHLIDIGYLDSKGREIRRSK